MKPSLVLRALKTVVILESNQCSFGDRREPEKVRCCTSLPPSWGLPCETYEHCCSTQWICVVCPSSARMAESTWATPDFLPQDGEGILFLDELNAAPAVVQASCYQLVLDRKLGEYTLPEGWAIVAAGNRDSDRAATTRMPTPLRNRFVHIDFEVDVQEWSEWAIKTGIRPEVIAFIRFRPELLSAFDRDALNAFPSPRSWEFVSRILNSGPDPSAEHELFAGAVGAGAATEFSAFVRMFRELPNIDAILVNPTQEPVPENAAAQYAVASALARCASDTNFDRLPVLESPTHRVSRPVCARRHNARASHSVYRWLREIRR